MDTLGIDISKKTAHVTLRAGERQLRKVVKNTPDGFRELVAWLAQKKAPQVHACLEATGGYGTDLAEALYRAGHRVSVVNPATVAMFARSENVRTKTDRADGDLLARYCAEKHPAPWTPPAPELVALQGLARRRDELVEMRTQETNRSQTPRLAAPVAASHARLIAELDGEIAAVEEQIRRHLGDHPDLTTQVDLLETIPGIGEVAGPGLLGEIGDVAHYETPRQLVAHAGMSVREHSSGTSVYRRPHLCKIGNARLRRMLYFPALVGRRHNPVLKALADRPEAAGKPKMLIIGALMRKLLHLIWGVLHHHKPFDPEIAMANTT